MNLAERLERARAAEAAAGAEVTRLEEREAETKHHRRKTAAALADARAALGVDDTKETRAAWSAARDADELAVASEEGVAAALKLARQAVAGAAHVRGNASMALREEQAAAARGKARALLTTAYQLGIDRDALIAEARGLLPQGTYLTPSGWGVTSALDDLWREVAAANGTYVPSTPMVLQEQHAQRRIVEAEHHRAQNESKVKPWAEALSEDESDRLAFCASVLTDNQFATAAELPWRVPTEVLQQLARNVRVVGIHGDMLGLIAKAVREGGRAMAIATSDARGKGNRPYDPARGRQLRTGWRPATQGNGAVT